MTTTETTIAPDAYTRDVIVRIYEVVTKPSVDTQTVHTFTVSLALTWQESRDNERESSWCRNQAWKRALVVIKRDKIAAEADTVTFQREKLVHSTKARPIRRPKTEESVCTT